MGKIKRWLLILIVTPLVTIAAWWVFSFYLFWFVPLIDGEAIQDWKYQKFAAEGVSKIEVASQFEEIFGPSSHYITPEGNLNPEWNSRLFLYGRYEFLMRVPVKIISAKDGTVAGQPVFYLSEISEVTTNNNIEPHFGTGWFFSQKKWEILYKAKGDFRVIGIELRTNAPVENIDAYIKASQTFE
jgi:hypothetical protein